MSIQDEIEAQMDAKETRIAELESELIILNADIEELQEQLYALEEDREEDILGEWDTTGAGDQD